MSGFVIHVSVIKKKKGFLCRKVMEMEMEVFVKRLHLVNHFMVDLEDSYKFGVDCHFLFICIVEFIYYKQ